MYTFFGVLARLSKPNVIILAQAHFGAAVHSPNGEICICLNKKPDRDPIGYSNDSVLKTKVVLKTKEKKYNRIFSNQELNHPKENFIFTIEYMFELGISK